MSKYYVLVYVLLRIEHMTGKQAKELVKA